MGWRGRREGGSGWGTHVNPWLIHLNVWQKPLQYCKVISLQLIKINGKKRKDPDAGKDRRQEEKGTLEYKMAGWHHQLNGHEFEQALGDGDVQGGLTCYSPWECRVRHD